VLNRTLSPLLLAGIPQPAAAARNHATQMALAPPPAAQAHPPLPDELLEDIFLRLDAADDLARASASCATFRRIVSARSFLRRFRSLHPQPVLGFLDCSSHNCCGTQFYQAQPPRKWAPAARAFAQAADLTFPFLRDPSRWRVRDARDGRVLLARTAASSSLIFDEFMVYDPLHRQYVEIPPIPVEQTAFTRYPVETYTYFETFLAPADWKEESSLCVFCNVMSSLHPSECGKPSHLLALEPMN
jgi:hypothetical protein